VSKDNTFFFILIFLKLIRGGEKSSTDLHLVGVNTIGIQHTGLLQEVGLSLRRYLTTESKPPPFNHQQNIVAAWHNTTGCNNVPQSVV
jgi:hypothetical protein